MRGMFTAGAIDVMMESGIDFDGVIGVSAGAAFGCNYKSKQIGRVIRYTMKQCNDKRYSGIGSLIKTGNIYNTDFAYGEVPLKCDVFDFDTYHFMWYVQTLKQGKLFVIHPKEKLQIGKVEKFLNT